MTHATQKNMLEKIQLKEIMHTPPIILHQDDKFHMVEKTLRENKIKHLPVVDDDNKLVGIITLSDLYRTCAPRRNHEDGTFFYSQEQLDAYILSHIMTKNPQSFREDDTLYTGMLAMTKGGYGCLLIVNAYNELKGVVTQTDVVRVVTQIVATGHA
jgi:CBS domain-containing protein